MTINIQKGRDNRKGIRFAAATLLVPLLMFAVSANAAYTLAWSDEFNGTSVDTGKWSYETGGGGWGNSELEYYTGGSQSSIIADGAADGGRALQILLTRNGAGSYGCWYGTCQYISSRMNSKVNFTRGRIEARTKHTQAAGFWPAVWMLGQNMKTGTVWPACGEIDIMEQRNTENINYGTMHWQGPSGYAYYGGSVGAAATSFQTYSVTWTDTSIAWALNGVQYWIGDITNSVNSTEEFHRPFYVLINFAAGGASSGFTAGQVATATSGTLVVDYVRVYQDSAVAGTVCNGCGTTSGSSSSSSSSSGGGVISGQHTLVPRNATGKRMDAAGGSTAGGTKVQIWTANGTGAQNWVFSSTGVVPAGNLNIALAGGANCVDVSGWGTADGTKVIIWPCTGGANQSWKAVPTSGGYYTLQPAHAPGKCLDVPGSSTTDGTQLQIWTCNGTNAQQWLPQ